MYNVYRRDIDNYNMAVTFTTPEIPAGIYKINWSFILVTENYRGSLHTMGAMINTVHKGKRRNIYSTNSISQYFNNNIDLPYYLLISNKNKHGLQKPQTVRLQQGVHTFNIKNKGFRLDIIDIFFELYKLDDPTTIQLYSINQIN
jgi:hypothetical protein